MFSQFITLGVPHTYGTVKQAWQKITDDVGKLMHAIRRSHREERGLYIRVSKPGLKDVARQNEERSEGRRVIPDLQYAWCVEPHVSGYPHLHMILNTAYVDDAWLKNTWGEITNTVIRWSHRENVYSTRGVCRYLAKYIAKCVFTPDLACLMFGRRLHYSSLPLKWKPPEGWSVEYKQDQAFLRSMTDQRMDTAERFGYTVKLRSPGRYAVMEKALGGLPDWLDYWRSMSASISMSFDGSNLLACDVMTVMDDKASGRWDDRSHHKRRARIRLT
jgi:hypothetical protein